MLRYLTAAVLALAATLPAQTAFFPLKDVRPGMRGVGRTVFSGDRIDEFQVEVLGILPNIGPKESLIIARLSGGPLERTGVMQGMSGSPVYIDGKLAGAVAMAFPFAKEPIAGIRPIEDMVRPAGTGGPSSIARNSAPAAIRPNEALALAAGRDLTRMFPKPEPAIVGETRMIDIATPISFGGFTPATLAGFEPQLRALGLEPRQGITAGAAIEPGMGDPSKLKPGSMISVQLMAGDMSVGADGTVTYIDGSRLYAFGHRFLDIGATALPFARAEVITLLPNLSTSFKVSAAKEWMGAILQDRSTAVSGELGRRPAMVPVSVEVSRAANHIESYRMQMVNDPLLSPLLLQMAVFSVIDRTERTLGAATLRVTGEIEFQNAPAPITLDNMYAADNGAAAQVSLNTALPAAYVLQSGFSSLKLKKVAIRIAAFDEKKELDIDSLAVSRREVHAGDKVQLYVGLSGENGAETTRLVDYQVPIGAVPGTLYFTVSDGNTANISDFHQVLSSTPRSAQQLIETVNGLHPNTKAYVRVWRTDPGFELEGTDLPAPPASVALILEGSQANLPGITQNRNSKLAEIELDGGGMVISGVKTVQLEIKE